MAGKTAEAQRRALQARRDRLRAAGLKNMNIWIDPDDEAAVRAYDRKHEVRANDDDQQA